MKPIRKVVILAAGLGTRFLPITKAIPKAMLPIGNKPVIQYLVEEVIASGLQEIIIVTGQKEQSIKEHFKREKRAKFLYVREKEALGDGQALLLAQTLIGEEPFAVLFGDDLVDHEKPALAQLLEVYQKTGLPLLLVEQVPKEKISQYGVLKVGKIKDHTMEVRALVEKPASEEAPSDFGIIGKYICTPDVLEALNTAASHPFQGELRLIDGLSLLLKQGRRMLALEVMGKRYDTGTPWGLLEANLAFALKDLELRQKLEKFMGGTGKSD